MGATYTRQSTYEDGDTITADHTNDEFDQLLAAFAASTGHTHDGTAAEGGPITKLETTSLTIGDATSGTDITVTFDGESNDGVLKWMEDEDYFEFSDDLLIATTEKVQFRDTGLYIYSSVDGQLDLVADTEIQIAATTIDINGAADISGNLGVGGNLTVTGTTTFNGGTITMGDASSDNVVFGADVNSSIIPNTDDTYDLGSSGQQWKDIYIDGVAYLDSIDLNGTAISSTAAELNIVDGDTSATSTTVADADRVVFNDNGTMVQVAVTDLAAYFDDEITAMPNLVSTGALNSGSITSGFGTVDTGSSTITTTGLISGGSLDIDNVLINGTTIGHTDDTDLITVASGLVTVAGEVSMTTLDIGGTNVSSTAAELNVLDGLDRGSIIYGNASSVTTVLGQGSANTVLTSDGTDISWAAASSSDLVDDTSPQLGGNLDTNSNNILIDDAHFIADESGNEQLIFQTTGSAVNNFEITNNASGSNPIFSVVGDDTNIGMVLTPKGTGEVVIAAGNLNYAGTAVTSTGAELNLLDGVSGLVQADLTKLAAVDSTADELNIVDGGTTATSTTVADADRVVLNDNGTMVQVAVTDLAAYFDDEITAMPNLVTTAATTVGALDSGSITSNFGTIDTGSSTITTTGLISGGSLDIDNVLINGTTIGHTDDTDLITLADGVVTVAGEVSMTTLDIGGTNVTATAAEINKLDALSRGSLLYGNASAATTVLTKGTANQVLTSDGTDISWADAAGGPSYTRAASAPGSPSAGDWWFNTGTNADVLYVYDGTLGWITNSSYNFGIGHFLVAGSFSVLFSGNGSTLNRVPFEGAGLSTSEDSFATPVNIDDANGSFGLSNSVLGVFSALAGTNATTMEFITMASDANSVDFGDLSHPRSQEPQSASHATRGIVAGGDSSVGGLSNVMDYITIASAGNATDFGNLTVAVKTLPSQAMSSTVRAVFGGGDSSGGEVNVLSYVTIASVGNATDFGDLIAAKRHGQVANSTTRGILAGGNAARDSIDFITIGSTGNATDFGNLAAEAAEARVAFHSSTIAYFNSGSEQVTMATAANATSTGFVMRSAVNPHDSVMPGWIAANG